MESSLPAVRGEVNQPGAWRALPILVLLYGISMLDRQILSLMVAPIKRDFGLSDFQIGLLQGFALSLLYSIASFPIGWMVDRYPRRPIIWIGVTLWSLFAAGCGLAQSFWQLFVARLGVGIGEASLAPAAYSMLADLFRRSRLAFAMSTMVLGSCIGNGVAIVLGGAIVTFAETARFHELPILGTVASWRYIFLLTGLPGLVIATMIFLVREPVRRKRTTAAHPPLIEVLRFIGSRRRFFTAHFIGFGLLSTMGWGFMSWLPTYMSRAFGWTIGQISLPLAVITGVGGAVGTLALGWLADHLFAKGRADAHMRIYVVVALGMTIAGVAAFQVHDPWLFLMLAAPVLATLSVQGTAAAALQIISPNEFRGQLVGLLIIVINGLGLGLGPAFVGAVTDFFFRDEARLGVSLSLLFAILGPIAALSLTLGLRSMREAVRIAESWRTGDEGVESTPHALAGANIRA